MKGFLNALRGFLREKEQNEEETQTIELEEIHEVSGEDFVGAICQISRTENQDSFMGRIESYDEQYNEFKISAYRSEHIPVRVEYNSSVKLQIKNGEELTLIYGEAKKQTRDNWWVTFNHVEKYSDQREGFRQPLYSMGSIVRYVGGKKQETITCKLIDISLTGICIASTEDLEIGDRIEVQGVQIYPDAPDIHVFDCEVRRAFIRGKDNEIINLGEEEEQPESEQSETSQQPKKELNIPEEKYYGCSFIYISLEQKEQLCKEIFFVQQQHRKAY